MKKILVFSDCHGNRENVSLLLRNINDYDKVVFLGDGLNDLNWYRNYYVNKIEVVKGNCDIFSAIAPTELDFTIEGIDFFATHGHLYGVKSSLDKLTNKAKLLGSKIVLYGHTHKVKIDYSDGIAFINPGSLDDYQNPSYLEILIENNTYQIEIKKLDPSNNIE